MYHNNIIIYKTEIRVCIFFSSNLDFRVLRKNELSSFTKLSCNTFEDDCAQENILHCDADQLIAVAKYVPFAPQLKKQLLFDNASIYVDML